MEFSGARPCVENRNPSIESTSLIHLLLHNSHHMFLLFCHHWNRSRLAVFADVYVPKNTHTHKAAKTIRMPIKLKHGFISFCCQYNGAKHQKIKVEVSHFFMLFQTSHSEHVELVIVCNANEFMVFEWIITFSSHKTCQGLFKIHISTENWKVLTFGERNLLPALG